MRGILAISVVLIVFALVYWLGADAIPVSRLGGAVGADGLPKLLAVVLGLLSAGLAVQTLAELRKRRLTGASSGAIEVGKEAGDFHAHARAFGIVFIGIGFLIALPVLGYTVSVGLLLIVVAAYTGRAISLATIAFGVLGAAFFYVMFVRLLQVPLPAGFWPSFIGA
jgi:putative tricarboxylic transport membrane protein